MLPAKILYNTVLLWNKVMFICDHVILHRPGNISALQNRDLLVHRDGLHGDMDAEDGLKYPWKCSIVHGKRTLCTSSIEF